jgi:hypothetical protein
MTKKSKKSYGIANKDYASFLVKTELTENKETGEIEDAVIDYSATEKMDAKGKDGEAEKKDGSLKSIKNIKELKATIRSKKSDTWKMPSLKEVKKYKKRTKKLRYKKGQKDGKGGRIISENEANIYRSLAKKDKISVDKAIQKYQNKKIKEVDVGYKGQHEFDTEIKDVTNKMRVRVVDSSGKVFNFYGTGKEITKNPNYIKLQTRNLNRIYKAIQKDF